MGKNLGVGHTLLFLAWRRIVFIDGLDWILTTGRSFAIYLVRLQSRPCFPYRRHDL
jgi:hypothetical protein